MKHRGLRELALRRQLLVTMAELQRAQLRHDLRHGPWSPALAGARTLWRWIRVLRAVLHRPPPAA